MFELSFAELAVVAVAALLFVRPHDMPKAIRSVMGVVRQIQGVVGEVKKGMDELVAESGLDDVQNQIEYITDLDGNRQPVFDLSDVPHARQASAVPLTHQESEDERA